MRGIEAPLREVARIWPGVEVALHGARRRRRRLQLLKVAATLVLAAGGLAATGLGVVRGRHGRVEAVAAHFDGTECGDRI